MSEKKGIKEFMELLIACMLLALALFKKLRDGFQMDDLSSIVSEVMSNDEIKEGFKGLKEVPAEVKDIDVMEGIEIAKEMLGFVPKFIEVARDK